jgi:hypothetical protein
MKEDMFGLLKLKIRKIFHLVCLHLVVKMQKKFYIQRKIIGYMKKLKKKYKLKKCIKRPMAISDQESKEKEIINGLSTRVK